MSSPRVVLIAPDSFKGTFSSVAVAEALARGWRRVRPDDELRLAPLADGGEGTLAAIEVTGDWARMTAHVRDPLGRPIEASWLASRSAAGTAPGLQAVIEMAEGSGLSRVAVAERDAVAATSAGLGDLLLAAIEAGAREIVVGIGGSASTDGGRGMLEALGARFVDARVDVGGLDPRLSGLAVRVACDVTNTLLGGDGAAAVYGPQKGASPPDVAFLEGRLAAWAGALETAVGRVVRDDPGAGAAGGVGFAFLAIANRFGSFELVPGVDLVMAATRFDHRLAGADLVLTGEGRIDGQTAFGKTAAGVARRARERGVRCIAVGGSVEPAGTAALVSLGATVIPVADGPVTLSTALAAGTAPIERAAERIASLIGDE